MAAHGAEQTPPTTEALGLPQRVLVTGAAHGIGRGVVEALLGAGSNVAAADVDFDAVSELAVEGGPGRVHPLAVDVADGASVTAMVAAADGSMGGIDGLVCCAGGFPRVRGVEELSDEEWHGVIDVNLFGSFACCRAVFPAMKRAGGGAIVCVSSEAGRSPGWLTGAHYVAAKAGTIGLVRHVAREGGPHGIRVNALAPGTTLTERVRGLYSPEQERSLAAATPLGRLAEVGEQVRPILFLLSGQSDYVNGATLDVNGGRLMM
jgi:NAD(P)-dependent dehydrogenase (short-subunit alcohol dehydrogenase family)